MKVIRRILVILVAMLAAVPAWSETLRWERYNLTFDVPDGGMVTHRTSTAYELQWHDLTFSIRLFDKSGADDDFLKYTLRKDASGYNMWDTKLAKSKISGFKGYTLTGTLPDGSRASLTMITSKKTNLLVQIEINHYEGDEQRVAAILKSLTEGKKPQKAEKPKKPKKQKPAAKPGTQSTPTTLYEI